MVCANGGHLKACIGTAAQGSADYGLISVTLANIAVFSRKRAMFLPKLVTAWRRVVVVDPALGLAPPIAMACFVAWPLEILLMDCERIQGIYIFKKKKILVRA